MFLNKWARKGLRNGDLSALSELSDNTRWSDPNPGRIERLNGRGFVKKRMTAKGRAAPSPLAITVTLDSRGCQVRSVLMPGRS
jgi:hypothetical protein